MGPSDMLNLNMGAITHFSLLKASCYTTRDQIFSCVKQTSKYGCRTRLASSAGKRLAREVDKSGTNMCQLWARGLIKRASSCLFIFSVAELRKRSKGGVNLKYSTLDRQLTNSNA